MYSITTGEEMRSQIWKYQLKPGTTNLHIPAGSKPLAFCFQGGIPQLWCQVSIDSIDDGLYEDRKAKVVLTGQEFDDEGYEYVGTSLKMMYVYHVYMSI
jgi:hypothetical protein